MGQLIIDGKQVYELDEECLKEREFAKKRSDRRGIRMEESNEIGEGENRVFGKEKKKGR